MNIQRTLASIATAAAIAMTASCATTAEEPPRSSTAPSAAATPIKLSRELEDLARNAGVAAAEWQKPGETDEIRIGRYESARFSPKLAKEFEPIWAEIFNHDSVQTAGVGADPGGLPTATSNDPARSLTVSVPVNFSARYHSRAGIPKPTPVQTAVWTLTIDPTKNQVTAITQPNPATFEFPIEVDDA